MHILCIYSQTILNKKSISTKSALLPSYTVAEGIRGKPNISTSMCETITLSATAPIKMFVR